MSLMGHHVQTPDWRTQREVEGTLCCLLRSKEVHLCFVKYFLNLTGYFGVKFPLNPCFTACLDSNSAPTYVYAPECKRDRNLYSLLKFFAHLPRGTQPHDPEHTTLRTSSWKWSVLRSGLLLGCWERLMVQQRCYLGMVGVLWWSQWRGHTAADVQ